MNKDLVKAQDILLDRINQVCKKFGLNNIMAQLYAILYLNNEVLSLDDMVERIKISKGSASVNIRALENYGAVKKVWIKGSRKDYYQADTDIVRVIMDRVKLIGKLRLSEIDEMIKSSSKVLNTASPSDKDEDAAIRVFKQRLEKLKAFHRQAQSLFDLINSGLLNNLLNNKPSENIKEPSFVPSVG
jgi:DNA-binding transcriptional regulator GbsR (MarR family)